MSKQLPPKPHIDVLRKQARQLLRDYQAGDPAASNLVKSALSDLPPSAATAFSLRHAHQVTAHDYGFASWQALVDQVGLHGNTKPFAQLPGHYEELATSLADAVLAGESGCESLEEFAAAVTGEQQAVVFDGAQLAVSEEFHAVFATRLTTDVTAAGQAEVTVEPVFTDQTTFGEYLLSVANGNAVFQMSADFLDGDFAVNLPVQVLHGIAPGRPVDRPAAVEAWGPQLARTLEGLWSPLYPGTVSVRD